MKKKLFFIDINDPFLIIKLQMELRENLMHAFDSFIKKWGFVGLAQISIVDYSNILNDIFFQIKKREAERIFKENNID